MNYNSDNNHNDISNYNINQGIYSSLLSDFISQKNLSDAITFSDPPSLLRFKANPVLPVAQHSTATSRIDGPYLKTYELNNQLPTPMNSFVESIYPLSELNNEIIQDISPFQVQPPPQPAAIFNPYAPNDFTLPDHMDGNASLSEPKRNFEEEANNLTRRIMEGNLKTDHSEEHSSGRLLHK